MEQIVVNDTNVFIDLYSVGLLEEFFSLPWEIYTTELVMLELLREGQNKAVDHYRDIGRLHIPTLYAKDMHTIVEMHIHFQGKTNVSVADCSVWYYARQNNYIILTGDRKLRKASVLDGVEVHGILYVFDKLVEKRSFHQQMLYKNSHYCIVLTQGFPMTQLRKGSINGENKYHRNLSKSLILAKNRIKQSKKLEV